VSIPHIIALCSRCGGTGASDTCTCDDCLLLSGAHFCRDCEGHGTVGPVCGRPGCDIDCAACREGRPPATAYACVPCLLGEHHRCPGAVVQCECPDPTHRKDAA
jgi:hypothetical protein